MKFQQTADDEMVDFDELDELDELEERALFARRTEVVGPSPAARAELESRVLAAVSSVADARTSRRAALASIARIGVGLAAGVTAIVGNGWLSQANHAAAVQASFSSSSRTAEATAGTSADEPLACAFPVSGYAHAPVRESACALRARDEHRTGGLMSALPERAICEDLVTSSLATP